MGDLRAFFFSLPNLVKLCTQQSTTVDGIRSSEIRAVTNRGFEET
jgi:hypothetical protein